MLDVGLTLPVSCLGMSTREGQDLMEKASAGTRADGNEAAGVAVAMNQKAAPGPRCCKALKLPSSQSSGAGDAGSVSAAGGS